MNPRPLSNVPLTNSLHMVLVACVLFNRKNIKKHPWFVSPYARYGSSPIPPTFFSPLFVSPAFLQQNLQIFSLLAFKDTCFTIKPFFPPERPPLLSVRLSIFQHFKKDPLGHYHVGYIGTLAPLTVRIGFFSFLSIFHTSEVSGAPPLTLCERVPPMYSPNLWE